MSSANQPRRSKVLSLENIMNPSADQPEKNTFGDKPKVDEIKAENENIPIGRCSLERPAGGTRVSGRKGELADISVDGCLPPSIQSPVIFGKQATSPTLSVDLPEVAAYELRILQHPVRARCCGFGNKDRRAIDPPPVVELILLDTQSRPLPPRDQPRLILHAALYDDTGTVDRSLVENSWIDPPETVNAITGTHCATPQLLKDHEGTLRLVFLFTDISVRVPGTWRLLFRLCDLLFGGPGSLSPSGNSKSFGRPLLATCMTDCFSSFRPKSFPGVLQTTELSKALAEQGISEIRIRR
ncbi:velvet factor-domain-containing protein [Gaertneriomyces semiglobifer]|nr:velvet factor-domain-containing protein [Gaertneriomyces semiglobifer]